MKNKKSYILILVGAGFCVGLFQNCSKITPLDFDNGVNSALSIGAEPSGQLVSVDTPALLISIDDNQQESQPEQLPEQISEQQQADSPVAEIAVAAPQAEAAPQAVIEEQPQAAIEVAAPAAAEQAQPKADIAAPAAVAAPAVSADAEESEAVALCLEKEGHKQIIGNMFSNLRGSYVLVSNQISEISDVGGKFIVRSESGMGSVGKIAQQSGKLVICNMNVDLISDTNGNITLVNSNVKLLSNHKGTIKTFNSSIESSDQKFRSVKR